MKKITIDDKEFIITDEQIAMEEKLKELTTTNPKLALENKRIDIEEPEEFMKFFCIQTL